MSEAGPKLSVVAESSYPAAPVSERGARKGVLRRLGTLAEISGAAPGEFWSNSEGAISRFRRLQDNPELEAFVQTKTDPSHLERFFARTIPTARVSCPDGRPSRDSADRIARGDRIHDRQLGPKIFGGSPGAALIHRLIDDEKMTQDDTFIDDIHDTLDMLGKKGIHFGGHIDSASHEHPEDSGCAAIDNIPGILELITRPKSRKSIKNLVDHFNPDPENDEHVGKVLGVARKLLTRRDQYFQNDKGVWRYKKDVVRALQMKAAQHHGHDPIHELVGPHNEVALIVNEVPGTLNRGRFNEDTGGGVQAFNYDFWLKRKMAADLYPGDQRKQNKFLAASIAFAMGVLGLKTDGSLDTYVREPV